MSQIAEQCDKATSPTTEEIFKRAKKMAAPSTEGQATKISSGLKWWRLLKNRNPALKERAAQMCDSQSAHAKLVAEDWGGFLH